MPTYHCSNKSSFHSDTNSHLNTVYSTGLTGQNLQMHLHLSIKINRTLNCKENLVCDSPFKHEMQHPPPEMTLFKTRHAEKKHLLFNTHTGQWYSTLYFLVQFDLLLSVHRIPNFFPTNQTCLTKNCIKP
jgi:hypothetical protein